MTAVIFTANQDEIKACFRDWAPVSNTKNLPVRNPHTGEMQMDWGPDLAAIKTPTRTRSDEIKSKLTDIFSKAIQYLWPGSTVLLKRSMDPRYLVNHAQIEGLDVVKMAILYEILTHNSFDIAMNAWDKPALLNLTVEDERLFSFPFSMVQALVSLNPEQVTTLAQNWAKTEELRLASLDEEDAFSILSTIKKLAIESIHDHKALYFWQINDEAEVWY